MKLKLVMPVDFSESSKLVRRWLFFRAADRRHAQARREPGSTGRVGQILIRTGKNSRSSVDSLKPSAPDASGLASRFTRVLDDEIK